MLGNYVATGAVASKKMNVTFTQPFFRPAVSVQGADRGPSSSFPLGSRGFGGADVAVGRGIGNHANLNDRFG